MQKRLYIVMPSGGKCKTQQNALVGYIHAPREIYMCTCLPRATWSNLEINAPSLIVFLPLFIAATHFSSTVCGGLVDLNQHKIAG